MTGSPFVSVVIPVLNGEATLRGCLHSLFATDFPEKQREIIVVDNGSTDGTRDIARGFPVRYVTEPQRGLSHARNRGIESSLGEIVAFTDSDCYVETRWLGELLRGFESEEVTAVGGEVVSYPPTTPAERYAAMRKPLWHDWTLRNRERPWFLFGNVAVRRDVFRQVGSFDPAFFGGSEDIDFCWRFFEAGFRAAYRPTALVFHHHRVTARSLFRQHVGYGRGQVRLWRKYRSVLSWGWRAEIRAWGDLATSAWHVASSWTRWNTEDRSSMEFYYPYLDLVRKLGQRTGFLRGMIADR